MVAAFICFGFVALTVLAGLASGLGAQVRKFGDGLRGLVISLAIVSVYGTAIMAIPGISHGVDLLQDSMGSNAGWTWLVAYIILFVIVWIALKALLALLVKASSDSTKSDSSMLSRLLGGALAGSVGILLVMLVVSILVALPGASSAIDAIREGPAVVFIEYNIFIKLF